ncbi:MAG TPA: DNA polymerase III subunit beta [Acidimicrobiales bacterium]|nr:DNA polymerase III subunit beta [Acidimicrobiales bacterium]
MKFRCERDVLVEALATAGRAVSNRSPLTALTGVRAELTGDRLHLTGTDLELTISVAVSVSGEADGVAVLPAKLTSDIVRALESGAVQVSVGDDEAEIHAGSATFSVRLLPSEGFPVPGVATGEASTTTAADFAHAVRQVVRAAGRDANRPVLTGVLLATEDEGLRLVATDSYRLAMRDLPGVAVLGGVDKVIVPGRALTELGRVLDDDADLAVRLDGDVASFTVGETTVITRLIDAEYPNYRALIPATQPNELVVGREALLEAVRRVSLMVQSTHSPIRLVMAPDRFELVAIAPDSGEAREELEASYTGAELTVAFNPEYLVAGIEAVTSDEVALQTVDATKPALLRGRSDDGFLYLLMPVRVS